VALASSLKTFLRLEAQVELGPSIEPLCHRAEEQQSRARQGFAHEPWVLRYRAARPAAGGSPDIARHDFQANAVLWAIAMTEQLGKSKPWVQVGLALAHHPVQSPSTSTTEHLEQGAA